MDLISLVVVILVLAVLIWAIREFLPGDATLKNLACFIIVVIAVLYVLTAFVPALHLR